MSIRYNNKTENIPSALISNIKRTQRNTLASLPQATVVSNDWVRPSDWLAITPPTSPEQKIIMLIAIYESEPNNIAFLFSGNHTIDWGDGTIENFSSAVQANHSYNYSSISAGTISSRGYKQVIITVTPQGGANLTSLNFRTKHPSINSTVSGCMPILEMHISAPYATTVALGYIYVSTMVARMCEYVNIVNLAAILNTDSLFAEFAGLRKVEIANLNPNITDTGAMFYGCISLQTVPYFVTSNVTNVGNMFSYCQSLKQVPLYDLGKCTGMAYTFRNCYNLKQIPLFDTKNVTSMISTFEFCTSIKKIPLLNTRKVTNMASMCAYTYSLEEFPLLDMENVTSTASMFYASRSLQYFPKCNLRNVTSTSSMFDGCTSLRHCEDLNLEKCTNINSMFSNCYSLTHAPNLNTPLVTNAGSLFSSCMSLKYLGTLTLSAATRTDYTFYGNANLKEIPATLDFRNSTNYDNMFGACANITSFPAFDTTKCTNMNRMFFACTNLSGLPLFNTQNNTLMTYMFYGCTSLTDLPSFNTQLVTDMSNAFIGCAHLRSVGNMNVSAVTLFTNTFNGCTNLTTGTLSGTTKSIDYSSTMLSLSALNNVFNGLGTSASQTITITNAFGATGINAAVSVASVTTTAGSISATTSSSVASLSAGMQITGTGTPLTTGIAVTFTDAGDLVNLAAHGLSNNDDVAFSVITTTTGIVINRIYYVVNANLNDFQVAATPGGTALPLTTNGSGTLKYRSNIASIATGSPNTIVCSRPLVSSATNTLSFRTLPTGTALMKGWTVTG